MVNTIYTGNRYEALVACKKAAAEFLNTEMDNLVTHPDYLLMEKKDGKHSMGVEEAEEILRRAFLLPVSAEKTVIIIHGIDIMTVEGQNRLLKTLEDANGHVLILASAKSSSSVLDTVKSRMTLVELRKCSMDEFQKQVDSEQGILLYFATGGYISGAEYAMGYIEMLSNVSNALKSNDKASLLDSLYLLKEKQKTPFEADKELFSLLFCFLSNWYGYKLHEYVRKDAKTDAVKTIGKIKKIQEETNRLGIQYTKNDLFDFIVRL